MTSDSDEKAIEVMARAIRHRRQQLYNRRDDIAEDDSRFSEFEIEIARAALSAYLKHCAGTMNEIVMGQGGEVEDGEKETRN